MPKRELQNKSFIIISHFSPICLFVHPSHQAIIYPFMHQWVLKTSSPPTSSLTLPNRATATVSASQCSCTSFHFTLSHTILLCPPQNPSPTVSAPLLCWKLLLLKSSTYRGDHGDTAITGSQMGLPTW